MIRSNQIKRRSLGTYKAFRNPKKMKASVMKRMVLGISSRNYEDAVESVIKGYGIKKSSISRHFVQATAEQMREFLEQNLSGLDFVAIFIDGIEFKGNLLVVSLGLDIKACAGALARGHGEHRGLQDAPLGHGQAGAGHDAGLFFVLDGSKALRSAVAKAFGSDVLIQRCQVHKRRNVGEQLPPEHQGTIGARLRAAYNMADYDKVKASLELTGKYLEKLNPSAAASLREWLEETLTVHKLGVIGLLKKTLSSTTNPIESCFSVIRTITGRVKRWRGGNMVQGWAVAALLRAERKFRRVQGYREIPKLIAAL